MKFRVRKYWRVLIEAGEEFGNDNATKLAASLAYATIFSIGPLMIIVISLMSVFYQKATVTDQVLAQASDLIGRTGAEQLRTILENTTRVGNTTLFNVIGGVALIFGATGIFTEIQSSINYIWSIKAKPKKSWLKYLLDRLVSFSLIIGLGFLMIVTLLINLLMDLLTHKLGHFLGSANVVLLQVVNIAVLFVVVTFLFTIIYKVLPDAVIQWSDAIVGAAFTGVLFLAGKFLITYYLGSSKSINAYGAAASIILLLSWVYYSSLILYFGAEFTKVYATRIGKGITVYDTAVYILKREAKELPAVKHPDDLGVHQANATES